jgi:CheY-like chemotaxis protein
MVTSSRGKILVIDDDDGWRALIGEQLQTAGYDVRSAASVDEAMHLLRQQPYHLGIVDLRLDEKDEQNIAGLKLAEEMLAYMPELIVIMLTENPPNVLVVRDALKDALKLKENGQRIASDSVDKDQIGKLLPLVQSAFRNDMRVNLQLDIQLDPGLGWPDGLPNDIECMQTANAEAALVEMGDLLQRIFHEAKRIEVRATDKSHKRSRVLVTQTIGAMTQNVIVRFSSREHAERELRNYAGPAAKVGGAKRTQLMSFRTTGRLGGITYFFYGSSGDPMEFQYFGDIYAATDTRNLKFILQNLFEDTCYRWYTQPKLQGKFPESPSNHYKEQLRLEKSQLERILSQIIRQDEIYKLSFSGSDLVLFAEKAIRLANPLQLCDAPFSYKGPLCYNHGDLHESNILVDRDNQTWLIDFQHTGPGHPARDFAMLECAIKFYLQRSNGPPHILHEWERSLLSVESLGSRPNLSPPLSRNPELVKATDLIHYIRSLLSQLVSEITLEDYLIALYFHALKGMTLAKKFNEQQRLHALISASLLVGLLQPDNVAEQGSAPMPESQDSASYDYDIFISYSHKDKDKEWVRGWLVPRLEEAGLRVCVDYRDFEIGLSSLENMERAVEHSRRTLLVFTPNWMASEWAEFESLLVQTRDPTGHTRRLLPLLLEKCTLPPRLAVLTYADFTQPTRRMEELGRLLAQIGRRPEIIE